MLFTALVTVASLAWLVALGRQALPRTLRVPLLRANTRELARDAARGLRELARLHRGRRLLPGAPPVLRSRDGPAAPRARAPRRRGG